MWYATPVNVQSFTTDFNFQITAAMADGFTFAIQNSPAGSAAVGGAGSQLGYGGLTRSVAVKFDIFNSQGEGSDSTGIYVNGADPTLPAVDMTASGVILSSGHVLHAHLAYDGTTLSVTITDTVSNATFSTSKALNIPTTVGSANAYVGFTGGTGGSSANQSILNWTYTSSGTAPITATPTFSPAAGTYGTAQSVTISDGTPGATIYYTTDGTAPTTASAVYAGAITVNASKTVQAIAVASGYTGSAVASAAYVITVPAAATPTFTPAAGTYSTAQSVTISDATPGATIYYTTNGATPTTASAVYGGPISVSATQTLKALAVASGFSNSAVASATYTIVAPAAATPTFSPAAGTYSTTQSVTISDSTPGAVIYYTANGTTPTTASAAYGGPISVSATQTLKALAVASGFSNSAVASAAYVITVPAVAVPVFTPAAGTYSTAQSVTISDTTSGAVIYYTTDGTTPTTSSAAYTAPISVSATQTPQGHRSGERVHQQRGGERDVQYRCRSTGGERSERLSEHDGVQLRRRGSAAQQRIAAHRRAGRGAGGVVATPVNVQSFTSDFDFQITAAMADGFTFAIQNSPAGSAAVGGAGFAARLWRAHAQRGGEVRYFQQPGRGLRLDRDLCERRGSDAAGGGHDGLGRDPLERPRAACAPDIRRHHAERDDHRHGLQCDLQHEQGAEHSDHRGQRQRLCGLHGRHRRLERQPKRLELDVRRKLTSQSTTATNHCD